MSYLIGVDLGTSGVKTVLFDQAGAVVAAASRGYPLYQPRNGWAEQDPEDWWEAAVETIRRVLEESGVPPSGIAGVGLSGQMHGLVMLGGRGEALRRCILWCDGRTGEECAEITGRVGEKRLIELTANPAYPGFTAGKILWARKNEPELYRRCARVLLPKDYLRYRLTGVFATEVSDASGTNLMDVPNRRWSGEILEKLGIGRELLPELYESCEVTGVVSPEAAALTGLAAGTPVAGGAGDNAAAAVGMGVVEEGGAFTTIGTSGVIYAHTGRARVDPLGRVHTFCAAVPGGWAAMSCTLAAGLSLKWLRDNLFWEEARAAEGLGVSPYRLMDRQAARSPIGANRLLFLPYLMGERSPLRDENARGVFFGLSAMHTKYDMLRAVMEGVAFSQRQCLEILRGMGVCSKGMLACGGGGSSPFWRQMLADLYGCPVAAPASGEGPALGAAILAGVAAGLYPDVRAACRAMVRENPPQQPDPEATARYEPYYRLYCRLYPEMKGLFGELAAL